MDFGLFYFADYRPAGKGRYRLLLEGAKFADTHGFASVWTPERHFHEFGGQYPNPAVTSAAIATVTSRVAVRAGSVVAPLHQAIRIAEDWSVVDNLSGGRVGISFAPGWHHVDFALAAGSFHSRKQVMARTAETVRLLWQGEYIDTPGGSGETVKVRIFPAPVQARLPVWFTSSGNPDTFQLAAQVDAGVLTHLLGQRLDDLAANIRLYRREMSARGHGPGHVVLMLHTFLGPSREAVRAAVREPFMGYLRSSLGLWIRSMPGFDDTDISSVTADDLEFLVEQAFERNFERGGLFGTVHDGMNTLRTIAGLGVDEIACLIDFVPDTDAVLEGLNYLDELRRAWHDGGG